MVSAGFTAEVNTSKNLSLLLTEGKKLSVVIIDVYCHHYRKLSLIRLQTVNDHITGMKLMFLLFEPSSSFSLFFLYVISSLIEQ